MDLPAEFMRRFLQRILQQKLFNHAAIIHICNTLTVYN